MNADVLAVCCSGSFSCVLMQFNGGKTETMVLEKQLLVNISMKGPIKPFPNNLKCKALHSGSVYSQAGSILDNLANRPGSGYPSKVTPKSDHRVMLR